MDQNTRTTEAQVVADLAKQSTEPVAMTVDGPQSEKAVVFAVPNHLRVVDLAPQFDEDRGRPLRCKGTRKVLSIDSFCSLITLYAATSGRVIVYANEQVPIVTAVLDDHGPLPSFRDNRIEYTPELSKEWKAWTSNSGSSMRQAEFGEFLEENTIDVFDLSNVGDKTKANVARLAITIATPPQLASLARDFTVRVKQTVREARSLSSGETQVIFATEHTQEDGRPLTVPGGFVIAIPVFKGGPLYSMIARLRYRIRDGAIFWSYTLERTDLVLKDAFDGLREVIRTKLPDLPIIDGNP